MKRAILFFIFFYLAANAVTVTLNQELQYQLKQNENKSVAENNAMANLKNLLMEDTINLVVSKRENNNSQLNKKERDFIADVVQNVIIIEQNWQDDVFTIKGEVEIDLSKLDAITKPEEQKEIQEESPDEILARIRKYRENANKTKAELEQMEIDKKYENSENQRLAFENFRQGRIAQSLRQYNTAIYYFEEVLKYDSDFPNTYFNLGVAHSIVGDYLKAIKYYKKAIKQDPKNDKAFYNLGISYDAVNNYNKAIDAYQEAVKLNPNYVQAFYNLGSALLLKGDYDKAIDAYETVLMFNPEFAEVYFNIGVAYDAKKVYEKAIKAYQKSISFREDYVSALANLGYAYFNNNQFNESIEYLKKAVELEKKDADIYLKLGKSYEAINADEEMIEAYQNAAYLGDKSAQNYLEDRDISW